MIALETPSQTDEHRKGPKRVVAAVLLAAAAVAAIALVAIRDDDPVSPADQPPPTQPATTVSATAQALEIAEGFLTWRYADPDRALSTPSSFTEVMVKCQTAGVRFSTT